MKGLLHAAVAITLAVAGTVVMGTLLPRFQEAVDLFLIVVVYFAITRPRMAGLAMGAVGGLTADIFGSHILGFQAFVKTGVAYAVGGLGAKLVLSQPVPQFLALVLATLLDGALAALLAYMAGLPGTVPPGGVGRRILINPLLGLMIYRLVQSRAGRPGG